MNKATKLHAAFCFQHPREEPRLLGISSSYSLALRFCIDNAKDRCWIKADFEPSTIKELNAECDCGDGETYNIRDLRLDEPLDSSSPTR